ncbi:MAG: DUF1080 domain-containing protein [Planctomycetes bacterium]|nr:DUF1080 domain-containing protein [Planctomycetota bacterium]
MLVAGLCGVVRAEDESPGVSLIARDSLAGWDAGPEAPRGWSVKNGVLHCEKGCSPITSAWTFGEFEFTLSWRGAPLELSFVGASDGEVIYSGVEGEEVDGTRTIQGKRQGKRIEWAELRGSGSATGEWDPTERVAFRFASTGKAVQITELSVTEPRGKPLFNGRDLTGWWTPGNIGSWPVIDGKIVCINDKGDYLRTEKEYGNFTLSFEYKMAKGGNSGVGIRTPRAAWPSTEGMELQLMDEPAEMPITRHSTMSIYGNVPPLRRNDRSEEWNRVVVKAEGYMISAWMNGELVQQVNTFWSPELKHRFLNGWIGLQDHGARTEFRNIYVLEGASSPGLDQWYQPRRMTGAQTLVNQLMNTEALSRRDVLRPMQPKSIDPFETYPKLDNGRLMGVFEGRGALLSISGLQHSSARLRMYVDGVKQPTIDCVANELLKHVPTIREDLNGPLVYFPFAHQLVVTMEAERVPEHDIEVVAIDEPTKLETVAAAEPELTRQLLPALSYRWEQHGHGGIRQHDRLRKAESEQLTIEPGARIKLVELDGTGVVHWFRLRVPTKTLQAEDLWLEITADGESAPTIAAPVRYFFPGLDQGKNYQNLVVLNKDGLFNRLAMPYVQGISFAVVNRAKRAHKEVQLQVAYDESYRLSDGIRLPLRGFFQRGGELAHQLPSPDARIVGLIAAENGSKSIEPNASPPNELMFRLPIGQPELRETFVGSYHGLSWRWWLTTQPLASQVRLPYSWPTHNWLVLYYTSTGEAR